MKSTERLIFHIDVKQRISFLGVSQKGKPGAAGSQGDSLLCGRKSKETDSKCTALAWRKTRAQMKNEDRQEE